jgi:hypothetical protein
MEPVTPKEMREIVEKIANTYQWSDRERRVLQFMIGYYGIDYPNEQDVKR